MSHEITKNAITGLFEFAYRADHGAPWHVSETGIDRAMPVGDLDNLDAWRKRSGMDWVAQRSRVRYGAGANQRTWEDQHVLFRSDTKAPLGIVSPTYKIVNPGELLELHRGLMGVGGLQISACGTTFGGREFWTTAKFCEGTVGSRADMIEGHLFAHSSLDGSRSTTVRRVVGRPVCNNTIRMAFGEGQKIGAVYKVSHRSEFNPEDAREYMDLNLDAWMAAKASMMRLANKAIDQRAAEAFVARLLIPASAVLTPDVQTKIEATAGYGKILALFGGEGKGSKLDGVAGTAWGLLNAVTEYSDHHVRATSDENRWDSSQFGPGAAMKAKAFALLTV